MNHKKMCTFKLRTLSATMPKNYFYIKVTSSSEKRTHSILSSTKTKQKKRGMEGTTHPFARRKSYLTVFFISAIFNIMKMEVRNTNSKLRYRVLLFVLLLLGLLFVEKNNTILYEVEDD